MRLTAKPTTNKFGQFHHVILRVETVIPDNVPYFDPSTGAYGHIVRGISHWHQVRFSWSNELQKFAEGLWSKK